jgi:hypothetical protein
MLLGEKKTFYWDTKVTTRPIYIQQYIIVPSYLINNTHPCYYIHYIPFCRSQWPRGLGRSSAAARLLRLWVRIPQRAWTFVCCECCVLSGRGLCDELITRPEESYRLWCVVVCDLENSQERPRPA